MKKIMTMALLLGTLCLCAGCGKKENKTEEQAQERVNQLQKDVESMQEDYKDYVRDMGIDVDAVLKEAGK